MTQLDTTHIDTNKFSLTEGKDEEKQKVDKLSLNIFELAHAAILPRTFKIERITIFILSFCIGLVTQLNDPALGVLKHYYITKRIRALLIGNSRFLIYNLLNQLLYCTA